MKNTVNFDISCSFQIRPESTKNYTTKENEIRHRRSCMVIYSVCIITYVKLDNIGQIYSMKIIAHKLTEAEHM